MTGCETIDEARERLRERIVEQERKLAHMGPGHAYAHQENGRLNGLKDAFKLITGLTTA